MLKRPITYTNFEGEEVTEEYYFNLTKAEILRLEVTTKGGFLSNLRRSLDDDNTGRIFTLIETLILESYGEKSEDGKRFIKTEELKNDFSHSEAYSELLMELTTGTENAKAEEVAAAFLNAVIPDMSDEADTTQPQDHKAKKKPSNIKEVPTSK